MSGMARVARVGAVAAVGLVAALAVGGCGALDRGTTQPQSPRGAEVAGGAPTEGGAAGLADKDVAAAGQQPASVAQRSVVRSAQLSLEVDDIYAAARRVNEIGTRFGGYVADERTDDRDAAIQLKVAADDLDEALTALTEIGTKVISRGQQAEDVTEQVVDIQARIASQRASVERVRALLDQATAIGEVVQIESELTRRQADLESLEQRAAALASQTELATVTVQLYQPGQGAAASGDAGFLDGLNAGWRVFLASTQVLLTVLGALLPFLVALAIPAALILWLVRRRRPLPAAPRTPSAGG